VIVTFSETVEFKFKVDGNPDSVRGHASQPQFVLADRFKGRGVSGGDGHGDAADLYSATHVVGQPCDKLRLRPFRGATRSDGAHTPDGRPCPSRSSRSRLTCG